ncbi:MAG: Acyl-CoA dehydrogenase [Acidimicrobiales bacterium]|jgi:alkylation response protein AidB-like acyl-CoA dehydrogenase|nr:Acyl-CoA dehydrogenase [Acidimicrobiales bacterium]
MDFTFSPDQEALRQTVRSFLDDQAGRAYVRAMIDDERGFTDELWSRVAEMGWLGLLIPEEHGGAGLNLIDLVVVQEEMGRLAFPGPYLSSAIQATSAATRLGVTDLLSGLADGSTRATFALEEMGAGDPIERVATRADSSGALDGVKPVVLDGHTADVALVVAREDGGALGTYLVDRPGALAVPGLDVTRKLSRLVLDGTPGRRVGPAGDQTALLRRVVDDINVALCAETVGACDRALQMAIDYSKARVQFDRPIATFQAIKHKIVDMLHMLELCRVGTHYAAWTSVVDDPAREAAAAMAKGYVGEAANTITAENIQVHGGVGFTWDVDCHLLFRRAKQNDVLYGQSGWQRQRLADLVLA